MGFLSTKTTTTVEQTTQNQIEVNPNVDVAIVNQLSVDTSDFTKALLASSALNAFNSRGIIESLTVDIKTGAKNGAIILGALAVGYMIVRRA